VIKILRDNISKRGKRTLQRLQNCTHTPADIWENYYLRVRDVGLEARDLPQDPLILDLNIGQRKAGDGLVVLANYTEDD
jgi:hypothetical protein